MIMKFYKLDMHGKLMKKESNETKIKSFGLKIWEKFLFQNQKKSTPKFGEIKNNSISRMKLPI